MCHLRQIPKVKWKYAKEQKKVLNKENKIKNTLDDSLIIFNPKCRDAIARAYESSPATLLGGDQQREARGAAPKKH